MEYAIVRILYLGINKEEYTIIKIPSKEYKELKDLMEAIKNGVCAHIEKDHRCVKFLFIKPETDLLINQVFDLNYVPCAVRMPGFTIGAHIAN
ncbi:MAG: hypothetical protein PHF44_02520 [Candidatus Pacebacteria bacterium]|nr:hypothetical protein [Candidatus Paceibacterota bacterium]